VDLDEEVAARRFRQDLLFRLNTVKIHVPSLRERREDILPLAEHFLKLNTQRYRRHLTGFDRTAIGALLNHPWPGNVRELSHVIERAVLMAQEEVVIASNLGLQDAQGSTTSRLEEMSLEEVERLFIKKTMIRFEGNANRAAEALGLSRSALYRRIQKYEL
jgi:DNA-binding NtrC family response regulator